jgi:hypothetical protein
MTTSYSDNYHPSSVDVQAIFDLIDALSLISDSDRNYQKHVLALEEIIVDLIEKTELTSRDLRELYFMATKNRNPCSVAIALIDKGLHPTEEIDDDLYAQTPLTQAYLCFNATDGLKVMKLLLDKGAHASDVVCSSWGGYTILKSALKSDDFELSVLLLEHGASAHYEEYNSYMSKKRTFTPEQRQVLDKFFLAQNPTWDLEWLKWPKVQ